MKQKRHRPDWRRGVRALRALLDDPDSTGHALEVSYALDGDMSNRRLARFLKHPDGQRLYAERPSLLARLCDREALSALPDGSFGRAYLDHMERNGFDPVSLVELRRRTDPVQERSEGEEWFAERKDLMHDLWHVLTGYGRDVAGESANLAFTYGQIRNRGIGAIVLASALLGPKTLDMHWPRYLWRAWRRGRRASMLAGARYEELMPLPLEEVRRILGVAPPQVAHPGGILVASDEELVAATT